MMVSITGTPGTGKTTLADEMRSRGYDVLDLNGYIRENGLLGAFDAERETYEVDIPRLRRSLSRRPSADGTVFIEGHLSHLVGRDVTIVLRCDPSVLYRRLKDRGYTDRKATENVRAEVLDVILCEAVDDGGPVYEIDCSHAGTDNIISMLEDILVGATDGHMPGGTDWKEDLERWF